MAERIVQEESLAAVADAIRAKSGTTDPLSFPDGFKTAIEAIQAGGGGGGGSVVSAPMKDVNFYDYDGTRLYSYTVAEAQALTQLPELPSQPGLICQGWNWTLGDIKAMGRAVDVGAMYITDDGKTRLYITIADEARMTVPLQYSQTKANGVTIDWGDGSAPETSSGTGNKSRSHEYASHGNYVITLAVEEDCVLGFNSGSSSYNVLGTISNSGKVYANMLRKVEIGKNVTTIESYMFNCCYSLESVTIPFGLTTIEEYAFTSSYSLASITLPSSVTTIGKYTFNKCFTLANIAIPREVTSIPEHMFRECYSLRSVAIPNGVTAINQYVFRDCYSLASIVIPSGVTSIGNYAFNNCQSLATVTIPGSVETIGNYAFGNCTGMAWYDFSKHTSIPTLGSNGAFSGILSGCEIRVPAALADEWKAATNWSTYASKIVAV